MRVFLAALVIALMAGPAYAQSKSIPKYGELEGKPAHEIKAEKEAEQAYQRSLGRIPEQKAASDPWGSVRNDSAPKVVAPKAVAKDAPAKRVKADGTAK
ncbi:hypothetical protein [Bradyrhizobium sp.]|uniref:hypothetical protein n=1 Tax=Bradyrhizobium sp. TaxID=376 RepID=UPI0025BD7C84|nr:hypothetical protein [Bradyrhizobium sp.]